MNTDGITNTQMTAEKALDGLYTAMINVWAFAATQPERNHPFHCNFIRETLDKLSGMTPEAVAHAYEAVVIANQSVPATPPESGPPSDEVERP